MDGTGKEADKAQANGKTNGPDGNGGLKLDEKENVLDRTHNT